MLSNCNTQIKNNPHIMKKIYLIPYESTNSMIVPTTFKNGCNHL